MNNAHFSCVVRRSDDLVTPHDKTIAGFTEQAKQKVLKATAHVAEAKEIERLLGICDTTADIIANKKLRNCLLFSAGLSKKAQGHLLDTELATIANASLSELRGTISEIRREVLFRFLLTEGDALGGSMRNWTGAMALCTLVEMVKAELKSKGIEALVSKTPKGKTTVIQWDSRCMLFDRKPKFVDKNIDIILLSCDTSDYTAKKILESKENYLLVGELKGGIDPAGADEHWKTATKALDRVRSKFKRSPCPKLVFAGAAIQAAMAKEIYREVKSGRLAFAANLTNYQQMKALVNWMLSL